MIAHQKIVQQQQQKPLKLNVRQKLSTNADAANLTKEKGYLICRNKTFVCLPLSFVFS